MQQTLTTNTLASSPSGTGLRDIKPPVTIPNPWLWVALAAGAVLLAALAFWAWRYWLKKRAVVLLPPPVPAHIRARKKLQDALALLGQPKEFCVLVSDTIRWYLEERFRFHAPERTTEEFLRELQESDLLLPDQKASLGEFLNRCDLVKFAKYEPRESELRDLHEAALRLIAETEPPMTETLPPGRPSGSELRAPHSALL